MKETLKAPRVTSVRLSYCDYCLVWESRLWAIMAAEHLNLINVSVWLTAKVALGFSWKDLANMCCMVLEIVNNKAWATARKINCSEKSEDDTEKQFLPILKDADENCFS